MNIPNICASAIIVLSMVTLGFSINATINNDMFGTFAYLAASMFLFMGGYSSFESSPTSRKVTDE